MLDGSTRTVSPDLDFKQETNINARKINNFRTQRGRLSRIPVVEVNRENLNAIWPYILVSLKKASFISIDLELSGLGIQRGWLAKSIADRYNVIRHSAQTRSVLSVGISIFELIECKETDKKKRTKYKSLVFNILTLCDSSFTVEPDGLQFLARHHFDFNRLINMGVPYYAVESGKADALKSLWLEILSADVPIIVHNGFIDLAFIYQHFYASLPESLSQFIANISDWFDIGMESIPGLYDSKYLAEYYVRMDASYLEYVFRKCQRDNALEESLDRAYISIDFDGASLNSTHLARALDLVHCDLPDGFYESPVRYNTMTNSERQMMCSQFSYFGFCQKRDKCTFLHNVDLVLDLEEQKRKKIRERRKRRFSALSERKDDSNDESFVKFNEEGANSSLDTKELSEEETRKSRPFVELKRSIVGCHRAGVDSFMTGFAVAYMCRMNILRTQSLCVGYGNRLPLATKTAPLLIQKSEFVEKTLDHLDKWLPITKSRHSKR